MKTGASDGIGVSVAKRPVELGHKVKIIYTGGSCSGIKADGIYSGGTCSGGAAAATVIAKQPPIFVVLKSF